MADEEGRMKNEEDVKREVDVRLEMIAKSVKSVGLMTGVGLSFCVALPSGERLVTNLLTPGEKDSKENTAEIATNIEKILLGFMMGLHRNGNDEETIEKIIGIVLNEARKQYHENKEEKNE